MCGKQDVDEANTWIWILTPSGKAEKKAVLITIRTVRMGHSMPHLSQDTPWAEDSVSSDP